LKHNVINQIQVERRMITTKELSNHQKQKGFINPFSISLNSLIPDLSWKNRRCFVVAGGQSLKTQIQNGQFNWEMLRGECVIGVNRVFEQCDPSIIFTIDTRYWKWIEENKYGIIEDGRFKGENVRDRFRNYSKGFKVLLQTANYFTTPDIKTIPCGGENIWGTSLISGLGTGHGANSGYCALNLACCLVGKQNSQPIYLLGFDLCGNGNAKQIHWHNGHPTKQPDSVYLKYRKRFKEMANIILFNNSNIINLNPNSCLKMFTFGDLANVKKVKKPIFISYYTKNGYEKVVEKLRNSLIRFGLDFDIVELQNLGNWQLNTHYKAKFILEMLEKHKDLDVCWVDADAIIQQYPVLFDNFDYDLSVCIIDWSRYTNGHRTDKQLASGTIYIRNNNLMREFLKDWIQENEEHKNQLEQKNMQNILDKWQSKIDFLNLPDEYCKIFDLMKNIENPIIEHFQVSRELRNNSITSSCVVSSIVEDRKIETLEKDKYQKLWEKDYIPSKCASFLGIYAEINSKLEDKLLDIGCGEGTTFRYLRSKNFDCFGVDITLAGLKEKSNRLFEYPIWRMEFENESFDFTFSTDTLEHIPPLKIEETILEILRITRMKTFHCIPNFSHKKNGIELHLIQKPIEWWKEIFNRLNVKNKEIILMDRKEFLQCEWLNKKV